MPERDEVGPQLSVLIPCWNAADTVERAMDSVLATEDIRVECVVVDDGSTDRTADRVEAIANGDARVVLVRVASNSGVSNARNEGLAVVRGEWLTFLDADDRLMPGAVAALMRPTLDQSVRAVVGQRIWTDGERRWVSNFYDIPDIREPGRKAIATHPGLLYYASATGKAFHRSLLDGLRFEGRVLGDQPWTIRALLRAGGGIEVIDETVYEWTRPSPGQFAPTITSTTRASAERSAEAAVIARRAFAEVSAEVDLWIPDEVTRIAVKRAYAERLIRSDFAAAMKSSIDRRDPGTGRLFEAIGSLLVSMPAAVLTPIEVVYRALLRPTWERWPELVPGARRGYWRMLEPIRRADPSVEIRLLGSRRLVRPLHAAQRITTVSPRLGNLLVRAIRTVSSSLRSRDRGRRAKRQPIDAMRSGGRPEPDRSPASVTDLVGTTRCPRCTARSRTGVGSRVYGGSPAGLASSRTDVEYATVERLQASSLEQGSDIGIRLGRLGDSTRDRQHRAVPTERPLVDLRPDRHPPPRRVLLNLAPHVVRVVHRRVEATHIRRDLDDEEVPTGVTVAMVECLPHPNIISRRRTRSAHAPSS